MMRTMTVWLGAVLLVGGLWSAWVINQGLADEPAAPSSSSEGTGGAAGNKTGGSDAGPPVIEGQPALPAEAGEVQERTVSLTQAVHFTDAKGQDVVVGPGSYRVDAEGTNRIRLLPAETGEAVVIDAVSFTHQQTVESPVPVTVPDPQQPDVLYLALVSPGGMGLEAIGTYSGVKPRAVTKMTAAMWLQIHAPTTGTMAPAPKVTMPEKAPTTGTFALPPPPLPDLIVVSIGPPDNISMQSDYDRERYFVISFPIEIENRGNKSAPPYWISPEYSRPFSNTPGEWYVTERFIHSFGYLNEGRKAKESMVALVGDSLRGQTIDLRVTVDACVPYTPGGLLVAATKPSCIVRESNELNNKSAPIRISLPY